MNDIQKAIELLKSEKISYEQEYLNKFSWTPEHEEEVKLFDLVIEILKKQLPNKVEKRTLYEILLEMNKKGLDLDYTKIREELLHIRNLFNNNVEYAEFKETGIRFVDKVIEDLNKRERINENEINACKSDFNKYLEIFERNRNKEDFR